MARGQGRSGVVDVVDDHGEAAIEVRQARERVGVEGATGVGLHCHQAICPQNGTRRPTDGDRRFLSLK